MLLGDICLCLSAGLPAQQPLGGAWGGGSQALQLEATMLGVWLQLY